MGLLPWLCGAARRFIKKLTPLRPEHLLNSMCATAASPGRCVPSQKTLTLKIPYIIVVVTTAVLISCKTYYISVDSLKHQFSGIDSSHFKEVTVKGPVGEVYRYKANPITVIKCFDNRNNQIEITNTPAIEMRVTHGGKRTIFYFDRVFVDDSLIKGVESRISPTVTKTIPLKEVSKIEIQNGQKNFRYIEN